jgi:hypothetical protein
VAGLRGADAVEPLRLRLRGALRERDGVHAGIPADVEAEGDGVVDRHRPILPRVPALLTLHAARRALRRHEA